jgi:GT2 family glycosyltransferase
MTLSIVIVTYNSLNYIEECIDSVLNNIGMVDLEIIVVDNSPIDKAEEMELLLMNNYFNKVKYIHNSENLGYGYGNNIGIRESNGEIICIMNPDIVISNPELFKDALSQFSNDDRLGMLGYKQFGGHNLSFYFRQEYFLPIFSALMTKLSNKLNLFYRKFMYLSGAFFFIKRETFDLIEGFDETFFLYNEESDITKRLLTAGYTIKYDKKIHYIHNIGDRSDTSIETFRISIDSAIKYLDKYNYNKIKYLTKIRFELKLKYYLSKMMKNEHQANNYLSKIKFLSELIN